MVHLVSAAMMDCVLLGLSSRGKNGFLTRMVSFVQGRDRSVALIGVLNCVVCVWCFFVPLSHTITKLLWW